jgi:hypothetical protein
MNYKAKQVVPSDNEDDNEGEAGRLDIVACDARYSHHETTTAPVTAVAGLSRAVAWASRTRGAGGNKANNDRRCRCRHPPQCRFRM